MQIRHRLAKPASVRVNALKSLGYTAILWAVFLFALPFGIWTLEPRFGLSWARFDPGVWKGAAVGVFIAAGFGGVWSGYALVTQGGGTPMPLESTHRLVVAGPYRYIRNPMSTLGIVQGIAVGIFLGSVIVIAYAIVGALIWHFILRPWEERDMRERFGPTFEHYRRSVPCWIPRLTAYQPQLELTDPE